MKIKLETLLQELGSPGKFQVCIFILLAFNYFPVVFNHIVMAFIGSPPKQYECYNATLEDQFNNSDTCGAGPSNTVPYLNSELIEYGKCSTKYFFQTDSNASMTVTCGVSQEGKWRYCSPESTIASEVCCICKFISFILINFLLINFVSFVQN